MDKLAKVQHSKDLTKAKLLTGASLLESLTMMEQMCRQSMTEPEKRVWVEWLKPWSPETVRRAAEAWSRRNLLLPKWSEFEALLEAISHKTTYWEPDTSTPDTPENRNNFREFMAEVKRITGSKA